MTTPGKGLGRKPVHLDASHLSGQDAVWEAVRRLKVFTRDDVTCWISTNIYQAVNDSTVKSYIKRLLTAGFIEIDSTEKLNGCATRNTYQLIDDVGVIAPKINKDGKLVTQGSGRKNLWRTMKILSSFSYRELAIAASTEDVTISEREAKVYVSACLKAGYLAITQMSDRKQGRIAKYRFIPSRNTGPKPLQIQKSKNIFDPNLNKVVWSKSQEDLVSA